MGMTTNLVVSLTAIFFSSALGQGNQWSDQTSCGLPPFTNRLPPDAKSQLENIWDGYVEGQDCTVEQAATKALYQNLPEIVRVALRPTKSFPPCGVPPFFDKLPNDMQSKLLAIWSDYVDGDDCKQRHKETRQLLNTLNEEQRKALRPSSIRRGNRNGPRP